MSQVELENGGLARQREDARLAALASTEILDTPPEPAYDAITRLAAEYFQADWAGISFADKGRLWIKSHWGQQLRELPRKNSIFDMVLAQDGPTIIPDIANCPELNERLLSPKLLKARFFAGVPVRSPDGQILGLLGIYCHQPRSGLTADELRTLEGLAEMVSSQLSHSFVSAWWSRFTHISTAASMPMISSLPTFRERPKAWCGALLAHAAWSRFLSPSRRPAA